MQEQRIETIVEEYLNKNPIKIQYESTDVKEQFKLKTVKRLFRAYDLYCDDDKFLDDFMIALRDYLIIFETDIRLTNISIPSDNAYGLIYDKSTGKYFATNSFPPSIYSSLITN